MTILPNWNKAPLNKGVFTPGQHRLVGYFYKLPYAENFFLTGGTALAEYYLGHRESHDLDFFTRQEGIMQDFTKNMQSVLGKELPINMRRRFDNFAELICSTEGEEVRIHLAYDSPFHLEEPIKINHIIINDFIDLVIEKLLTFFACCELRDAIDLFFILEREMIPFWDLKQFAKQKDPGFDLYWMARACEKVQTFPDDFNRWNVKMILPVQVKEIKDFFRNLAIEIIQTLK